MSFILGRMFNSLTKSFISDRVFSFAAVTSLSTVNHYGSINNDPNYISYRKMLQPVQIHQYRYFSITFDDSLYQSVTSNEATKLVIDALIKAHDLSGLHWWSTLVAAPVIIKLICSIPCAVYQHKLTAKTELITIQSKPLITNLRHELMIEGNKKKWPAKTIEKNFKIEAKKIMKKIMINNNIHPFKLVILSLIQIPPWILMTMSISELSKGISSGTTDSIAAALQFPVGGPFWCPDLTVPDSTFILPITVFLFTLANFEINFILKRQREAKAFKIANYMSCLFAVILLIIALQVSSGLTLFWTSNAIFGLVQTLALYSPRVRRLLRIPKTPSELEKPYSYLANEVRNKWNNLFPRK